MTTAAFDSALIQHLNRINAATNVLRVREQDIRREVVNGGTNGDLVRKVARAAVQLKRVADELEKAIT